MTSWYLVLILMGNSNAIDHVPTMSKQECETLGKQFNKEVSKSWSSSAYLCIEGEKQ